MITINVMSKQIRWNLNSRRYQERHKEKVHAYNRSRPHAKMGREYWRKRQRRLYAEDPEKFRKATATWRELNPDKHKAAVRRSHLRTTYGKDAVEFYDRLYREQEGRCAICSEKHEVLYVDHCHVSKNRRVCYVESATLP